MSEADLTTYSVYCRFSSDEQSETSDSKQNEDSDSYQLRKSREYVEEKLRECRDSAPCINGGISASIDFYRKYHQKFWHKILLNDEEIIMLPNADSKL